MSNKRKHGISMFYLTSKKNLSIKYNSFENSYTLVCINNLIYTENCHIVARFKDFLYYDDDTEFFNKFFFKNEQKKILTKVFNFYSKYCKVFPNYMILPENEFLYRNLRKKQKLIDQFNEIKKEEEENRKHLKLKKNKDNENNYIIFGKKEQDSIEQYKPSFTQSTIIMKDYLNFNAINNEKSQSKILNEINNSKNSITISLNYNNNLDINDMNSSELTLISITNLIKKSPTKTEKNSDDKNNNKLSFTPTKNKTKTDNFHIPEEKIDNPMNEELKKKYISYYQNKNIGNSNNYNDNSKTNNQNNYHYNTNMTNKGNNNKKEILSSKKNNVNINNINVNNNNISQGKPSNITNNILISSVTKTSTGKDSKNISKNIKSAITKKKLFTTEKTISHKQPIYNYQNKKIEKNSNSINNNNKHKKNFKDMIAISFKPSISPPGTKMNTLKLKIMDNLIKIKGTNKNINNKSPSNNSISNNISYVNKINKNIKVNENEKINLNFDKKIVKTKSNNANKKIISTKEKIKNYKNILKMDKTNHFSHDINKNHIIINKNNFTSMTEKISYKNTSNDKIRKTKQNNQYISPSTKKYTIMTNNKNIKTPHKQEVKQNDTIKKIILNTKEGSQVKIQNYIKKILDKNITKKEIFINKSKNK